ncbi:hypothetical protein [Hyphomicrobium sp. CS1BSMeth3]|uniref:hypothetical protein n=1 Tax=Hyphomicrobium sp. CS1BSMeth3 TaxID=1892844 RepID=UPI0011601461|nr:hypothetical protein [Hyphomicrobium sp. CS1BSMeth3]
MTSAGNGSELHHQVPVPLFNGSCSSLSAALRFSCQPGSCGAASGRSQHGQSLVPADHRRRMGGGLLVHCRRLARRRGGLARHAGGIEIKTRNPFWRRGYRYALSDIAGFSVEEVDWDSGGPTWRVVMTSRDGYTHKTRDYDSQGEAARLKSEIEAVLQSHP